MPEGAGDLAGRAAIVTGSTRGIGLGIARALAGAGAAVVVSGEDAAEVAAAEALLAGEGAKVRGIACDVTDAAALVAQLARSLAVQWGPRGVRVNAVAPGLIATPRSEPLLGDKAFMARRLQMTPLRRVGTIEDVATTCLFLASSAAGFITGQHIAVDGGTSITDGS